MTPKEIRKVSDTAPTIDRIDVAAFESHAAQEITQQERPAFVR
jgi:hypothetical protein